MRHLGLALSSGGARGAAQIGVLRALEEAEIPVHAIAGVSVGAQVGGLYAAGVPLTDIEELWARLGAAQMARGLLPTFPYRGWSAGQEVVRGVREMVGDLRVENTLIRFVAVATDLATGQTVTLDRGALVDAVRASTAIPGLFTPARVNGRLLVDGGLSSPLPVNIARELGSEVVLGVDVLASPAEKALRRPNVFTILLQMSTIFQKRIAELQVEQETPDLLVRPDFGSCPPSYGTAGNGVEVGYRAATATLPKLNSLLHF
ncbi:MAG: patatin-like phospholipase family protein [Candidatus Bipolaricaulota bacterium]